MVAFIFRRNSRSSSNMCHDSNVSVNVTHLAPQRAARMILAGAAHVNPKHHKTLNTEKTNKNTHKQKHKHHPKNKTNKTNEQIFKYS